MSEYIVIYAFTFDTIDTIRMTTCFMIAVVATRIFFDLKKCTYMRASTCKYSLLYTYYCPHEVLQVTQIYEWFCRFVAWLIDILALNWSVFCIQQNQPNNKPKASKQSHSGKEEYKWSAILVDCCCGGFTLPVAMVKMLWFRCCCRGLCSLW